MRPRILEGDLNNPAVLFPGMNRATEITLPMFISMNMALGLLSQTFLRHFGNVEESRPIVAFSLVSSAIFVMGLTARIALKLFIFSDLRVPMRAATLEQRGMTKVDDVALNAIVFGSKSIVLRLLLMSIGFGFRSSSDFRAGHPEIPKFLVSALTVVFITSTLYGIREFQNKKQEIERSRGSLHSSLYQLLDDSHSSDWGVLAFGMLSVLVLCEFLRILSYADKFPGSLETLSMPFNFVANLVAPAVVALSMSYNMLMRMDYALNPEKQAPQFVARYRAIGELPEEAGSDSAEAGERAAAAVRRS